MKWSDNLRYGTVFRSTREGSDRNLTLMFVGAIEADDHISALLIDCDLKTAIDGNYAWRLGHICAIDVTDFWRFEVVE